MPSIIDYNPTLHTPLMDSPFRPTSYLPGTEDKIRVFIERHEANLRSGREDSLFNPSDATIPDGSRSDEADVQIDRQPHVNNFDPELHYREYLKVLNKRKNHV